MFQKVSRGAFCHPHWRQGNSLNFLRLSESIPCLHCARVGIGRHRVCKANFGCSRARTPNVPNGRRPVFGRVTGGSSAVVCIVSLRAREDVELITLPCSPAKKSLRAREDVEIAELRPQARRRASSNKKPAIPALFHRSHRNGEMPDRQGLAGKSVPVPVNRFPPRHVADSFPTTWRGHFHLSFCAMGGRLDCRFVYRPTPYWSRLDDTDGKSVRKERLKPVDLDLTDSFAPCICQRDSNLR